jgi:hypothetical protein
MANVANAFLTTLTEAQKAKAQMAFNDEERLKWFFVPQARKGLPMGEMNEAQVTVALELLRTGLSSKGYDKAATIRALEPVLRDLENGNPIRNSGNYYFSIFGTPAADGTWGWRYEGHHCSQNWTVVGGKAISSSPQFFGSNPAEVLDGPLKGLRALKVEEDLARELVLSLDKTQQGKAIVSAIAPSDIITSNKRQVAILEDNGIAYSALTPTQQGMLLTLIEEYANSLVPELAHERMDKVRQAGLPDVKFAWMGSLQKRQGHYYRIQGKTFLIEFDDTQNDANHIHTVWRDFKGDFGIDLLALHYAEYPHGIAPAGH